MTWLNKISEKHVNNTFVSNVENDTINNNDYRKVLFTTHNIQLVLMSLKPQEEIGVETHGLDQFLRFEQGEGKVILDGTEHKVSNGSAVIIPAGTKHNVVNTSSIEDLKLYTLYSPPNHEKGTLHKTKSDETEEHFDGNTDV